MGFFKNVTSNMGIIGEFMKFLWSRKWWWLIPMFVVLLLFGVLVLVGSNPAVAPFIYPIF